MWHTFMLLLVLLLLLLLFCVTVNVYFMNKLLIWDNNDGGIKQLNSRNDDLNYCHRRCRWTLSVCWKIQELLLTKVMLFIHHTHTTFVLAIIKKTLWRKTLFEVWMRVVFKSTVRLSICPSIKWNRTKSQWYCDAIKGFFC